MNIHGIYGQKLILESVPLTIIKTMIIHQAATNDFVLKIELFKHLRVIAINKNTQGELGVRNNHQSCVIFNNIGRW